MKGKIFIFVILILLFNNQIFADVKKLFESNSDMSQYGNQILLNNQFFPEVNKISKFNDNSSKANDTSSKAKANDNSSKTKNKSSKKKNHQLIELWVRAFYPPFEDYKVSYFAGIGLGFNHDINKIISPGLLFDFSTGGPWANSFLDKIGYYKYFEDDKKSDYEDQRGFGAGVKIYNMIKAGNLRMVPFIGCNCLFYELVKEQEYYFYPVIGMSLSYKWFGIEYANYVLGGYTKDTIKDVTFDSLKQNFKFGNKQHFAVKIMIWF